MKATENLISTAGYIIVGILFALSLNFGMALIFNTDLPIVAVQSCSMVHTMDGLSKFLVAIEQMSTKNDGRCNNPNAHTSSDAFKSLPLSEGFDIGDLLLLSGYGKSSLREGDVIVFTPAVSCSRDQSKVPIVHRIVSLNNDGSLQTKGDANTDQLPCEKIIQLGMVHGKAVFIIPYLGWIKIFAAEVIWPNILLFAVAIIILYAIWSGGKVGDRLKHI